MAQPAPSPAPARSASPETVLWLIRHAEVEADYQNVFGGRIDMGLSPRGLEQAARLAEFLQAHPPDVLYASPMKRVQQTLAPVLVNGFPRPVIRPDLKEIDFGDWTGLSWNEIPARYGVTAEDWLQALEGGAMANGESAAALRSRVGGCLREILGAHRGQTVAIACHGGVIRMLLALLLELPLAKLARFEIDYASVSQVAWLPQRTELRLLNFTPWSLPQP